MFLLQWLRCISFKVTHCRLELWQRRQYHRVVRTWPLVSDQGSGSTSPILLTAWPQIAFHCSVSAFSTANNPRGSLEVINETTAGSIFNMPPACRNYLLSVCTFAHYLIRQALVHLLKASISWISVTSKYSRRLPPLSALWTPVSPLVDFRHSPGSGKTAGFAGKAAVWRCGDPDQDFL